MQQTVFAFSEERVLDNPKLNLWQNWLLQYELEPYLLIQTCRSGYKVGEIPVTKRYHNDMKKIPRWFHSKAGGRF